MAEDTAASRAVENLNLESQVNRIRDDFAERAGDLSGPLLNTAGRIGGAVISVIMVLVLAFMMLVEGPLWIKKFISLQPASKRKRRERIAKKMYRVVTGYVNGQVLVAATGGVFALIALLIGNAVFDANVNAVALAGIVFVFALIPMIGTTIGAVLVVLITLLASLPFALAIGIFFIIYQQIENVTLQPLIQSKTNQLTPLTVLAAALLGIGAAGLIGAIAAIPIAGCIKVLLEERFWNNTPGLEEARQSSK
jgi:predicted PurR-regulated permease PerM